MDKVRMLLVDNDRELVESTKPLLEEHGFEVLFTHSAREGWEMVVFEEPDVVVTEIMLERHDSGLELVKRIKGDPRYKRIPVLLLTSVAKGTGYRFDFEKDGYWMKADGFAEKPLAVPDLVKKIEALLEKARGEGSS